MADYLGYEGEGKKAFLTALFGIKLSDENPGKFDKTSVEKGKKLHDMLAAAEDKILKQIESELDPQKVAELQRKVFKKSQGTSIKLQETLKRYLQSG
ncbi:MAG: hypothetical protein II857_02290 [Selenomonadaceae bacterium]|nr:hypothetical protein [Selenomonadaceae bacterium]